jgi:hypothetical protein
MFSVKTIFFLAAFLLNIFLYAQSYIGSNSSIVSTGEYNISYSVGEVIIGYNSDGSNSALIGMQQPLYVNMFGAPSLTYSTISANPSQIDADGASTSSITVTLKDSDNEAIPWGGEMIEIIPSLGSMSPVTDNNNGTYAATLTSSDAPGTSTITYEINGFEGSNTAEVDFLEDCSEVPEDVDIPDGDLGSQTIIARNTISTGGTVATGNEVTLVSGTSITLKPGFTVSPGALFSARIDGNLARITNCASVSEPPVVINEEVKTSNQLMLYPNPSSGIVTAHFNLEHTTKATLRVFDFMGRLIQTLSLNTFYSRGFNEENLNLKELKGGVYTVQVSTAEWTESKNIVIVKS